MRGDGGEVGIRGGGRKEVGEVGRGITVQYIWPHSTIIPTSGSTAGELNN